MRYRGNNSDERTKERGRKHSFADTDGSGRRMQNKTERKLINQYSLQQLTHPQSTHLAFVLQHACRNRYLVGTQSYFNSQNVSSYKNNLKVYSNESSIT